MFTYFYFQFTHNDIRRMANDFLEFRGKFQNISFGIILSEMSVIGLDICLFLVLENFVFQVFQHKYSDIGKSFLFGNTQDISLFPKIGYCSIETTQGIRSAKATLPLNHNYWNAFLITLFWQILILAVGIIGLLAKLTTLFSFKARKMTFCAYVSL